MLLHPIGFWVPTAAPCTPGSSSIPNLSDISGAGSAARVGAKWDSDTLIYTRIGTTSFGTGTGDWSGSCLNTGYEGRWIKISGDNPSTSTGAVNVWHSMTTDVMVGYDTPADDFIYSGTFEFQLRRASDSVTILTDQFIMYAEELPEPPD